MLSTCALGCISSRVSRLSLLKPIKPSIGQVQELATHLHFIGHKVRRLKPGKVGVERQVELESKGRIWHQQGQQSASCEDAEALVNGEQFGVAPMPSIKDDVQQSGEAGDEGVLVSDVEEREGLQEVVAAHGSVVHDDAPPRGGETAILPV
ncbi:hypothetical protein KP509_01G129000 [Ceratopteris richardii]|uniref:Uncharacterized protein n=1 Tax=Ceratopteris richardii TaxID=49495 RepID=A0A8T2VP78_CERRI|nr:hypothetical protein KP509_01G129000 [Ceratopteris richardii]